MSAGLDPTLGAVLALVGVFLGALAAGGVTYWLGRRHEKDELRSAARLLVAALVSRATTSSAAAPRCGALSSPQVKTLGLRCQPRRTQLP